MKYAKNQNVPLLIENAVYILLDFQFYVLVMHYTKKSHASYTGWSCASAFDLMSKNVAVKGVPSSSMRHFTNKPLDRSRRIAVEIRAPVKDDPGQVVLGRDSV